MLLTLLLLTWLQCFVLSSIHQYINPGHGQMGVIMLPQILVIYTQSLRYYFNISYFVNIIVMECPFRWVVKAKRKAPLFKAAKKWGKANKQDVLDTLLETPVFQQQLNGCRHNIYQVRFRSYTALPPHISNTIHRHGKSCKVIESGVCFCVK